MAEVDLQRVRQQPRSRWLLLVLALYFALAVTYGLVTPLWEAPDEPQHAAYAFQLARGGGLPVLDPAAPGDWRQEGGQPPLYYLLVAAIVHPIDTSNWAAVYVPNPYVDLGRVTSDGNVNAALHSSAEAWPYRGAALAAHIARLVSALLGVVTVLSAYLLGREVLPDAPGVALGAAALTAFNPMFLFISGAITNDALAIALCSLTVWLLVRALRRPPTVAGWALRGALVGLAALTKLSALALVPLAGLVAMMVARQHDWRQLGRAALGGLLPVLAIAGWWFVRNWRLYGDPSGLAPFIAIIGRRYPPSTLVQLWGEREGLALSYVGLFGWMNLPAPTWAVYVQGGILAVGWLAAPWGLYRQRTADGQSLWSWRWTLVLVWPLILLISLVRWTLLTPATQGRLLFPAIGCLSLCAAFGWHTLATRRWGRAFLVTVAIALAGIAAALPWTTIAPAYRPPEPMMATAIPSSAQRLDADLGGGLRLLGVELPTEPLSPGGEARLTLYWQADTTVTTDYAAYVHLIGANERIVAQRDRFPGRGLLLTSQMQAGAIYADPWAVRLSETMLTPEQLRVVVGLVEPATGIRPASGVALGELSLPARVKAEIPNPLNIRLGEGVALIGYTVDRTAASPGEPIALTLYWQALADGREDLTVFCQLQAEQGAIVAQHDGPPRGGERPTSTWHRGDIVVDEHVLQVREDAPAGVWTLHVGLYNSRHKRLTVLGEHGEAQARDIVLTPIRVLP
ncbi:MAG: glycosyltransferase family 39 protein [Anaerolineales bacterium]